MGERSGPEPLPAYLRIAEMLTRDIASGRLADGSRLPPERDLAPELGVSVGTLRKALAELEARGLLNRRHGSGNYVRFEGRAAAGYTLFRLELRGGGGQPHARVLDVGIYPKPDGFDALGPDREGLRIRRLRFLSDVPVALEEIWVSGGANRPIDAGRMGDSLYRYYQEAYGLWILRAEDRISGGTVPDWAPTEFPLPPGQTAARIDRLAWDQNDTVAEMSVTHFDANRASYRARVP